jgi:Holliday junction resolvase
MSRDKGARGEREFANLLSAELGTVVRRKLGQARDSGDDIQVEHFRIEVKHCERLAIPAWCAQVEAACEYANEVPVVAFRRSGEPWRCVVPAAWFIRALREELDDAPVNYGGTD